MSLITSIYYRTCGVLSNLMRILRGRNFRDETFILAVEVDEHECGQHENADHTVTTEGGRCTEVGDKHTANNGTAASTQPMMQSLQYS